MSYNDIIKEVAKILNIPPAEVDKAYKSYWEFIRASIQDLNLQKDISEEEFSKLKTNFNIPSLGKLHCTYNRLIGVKKRSVYLKNKK